jgi:hypothetical protein
MEQDAAILQAILWKMMKCSAKALRNAAFIEVLIVIYDNQLNLRCIQEIRQGVKTIYMRGFPSDLHNFWTFLISLYLIETDICLVAISGYHPVYWLSNTITCRFEIGLPNQRDALILGRKSTEELTRPHFCLRQRARSLA